MLATCQADIFRHVPQNRPDMTIRAQFPKDMPVLATCQVDIFQHVPQNQPDMTTRAQFPKDMKTTSATKGRKEAQMVWSW